MTSSHCSSRPIVLVDDEPLILETFGLLLRSHLKCDVYTFSSPFDALQQLVSINPGIIISDYSMPGMTGLKFFARAQKFLPRTNFVLITGGAADFSADELDPVTALKGILRKPLHWKVLAEFVVSNWPDAVRPTVQETVLVHSTRLLIRGSETARADCAND